ncbi:MAG: hypothetical protein K2G25_09110 [Oscillospiraceae bacterium]|nr:hypothetical protein [Oscillospiraceae bacterium]
MTNEKKCVIVLKADVMASASDPFAFVVMFLALVIVFFLTKWYMEHTKKY